MVFKKNYLKYVFGLGCMGLCAYAQSVSALTYSLPAAGEVVGELKTTIAKPGDDIAHIAREHDMGFTEIEEANPNLDPDNITPGTVVVIPSRFILPNTPHNGLVINLAEMRLYYYPKNKKEVITHPLGIGREGDDTPIGVLKVIQHIPSPTWHVPQSILKSHALQGENLPKSVPPGPDNPLGKFAMRLSNLTYLIHGTNDPYGGIGLRSSSGCLRLYPEDIETLYRQVSNGTNVYIVNEPYKAGWLKEDLYIESHVPLEQKSDKEIENTTQVRNVVELATKNRQAQVDWDKVVEISSETQGWPQVIGRAG